MKSLIQRVVLGWCLVGVGACSSSSTTQEPTQAQRLQDSVIETQAATEIAKAHPDLEQASHIVVSCFNGVLLIAGQTPRSELKTLAGQVAGRLQGVRSVHNELQLLAPSSLLARSNDGWLTTRIKARLLAASAVDSDQIQVLTENGIVYLMGVVSRQMGAQAAQLSREVSGVQKVIKLFEYTH